MSTMQDRANALLADSANLNEIAAWRAQVNDLSAEVARLTARAEAAEVAIKEWADEEATDLAYATKRAEDAESALRTLERDALTPQRPTGLVHRAMYAQVYKRAEAAEAEVSIMHGRLRDALVAPRSPVTRADAANAASLLRSIAKHRGLAQGGEQSPNVEECYDMARRLEAGPVDSFDFAALADDHGAWSDATFGPGDRTDGILDHIDKERAEVAAKPSDPTEWADVVLLAIDGARRAAGTDGAEFFRVLAAKIAANKARTWPDWRTAEQGKAIEHVRDEDRQP